MLFAIFYLPLISMLIWSNIGEIPDTAILLLLKEILEAKMLKFKEEEAPGCVPAINCALLVEIPQME